MIEAIGGWVVALPSEFLSDSYLKYLAWALSDRSPLVRLQAVKALTGLYDNRCVLDVLVLVADRDCSTCRRRVTGMGAFGLLLPLTAITVLNLFAAVTTCRACKTSLYASRPDSAS